MTTIRPWGPHKRPGSPEVERIVRLTVPEPFTDADVLRLYHRVPWWCHGDWPSDPDRDRSDTVVGSSTIPAVLADLEKRGRIRRVSLPGQRPIRYRRVPWIERP